jgi:hypothetical protein
MELQITKRQFDLIEMGLSALKAANSKEIDELLKFKRYVGLRNVYEERLDALRKTNQEIWSFESELVQKFPDKALEFESFKEAMNNG